MPVEEGRDRRGSWSRWGEGGKKYYWANPIARAAAWALAARQGRAIHARANGRNHK